MPFSCFPTGPEIKVYSGWYPICPLDLDRNLTSSLSDILLHPLSMNGLVWSRRSAYTSVQALRGRSKPDPSSALPGLAQKMLRMNTVFSTKFLWIYHDLRPLSEWLRKEAYWTHKRVILIKPLTYQLWASLSQLAGRKAARAGIIAPKIGKMIAGTWVRFF